VAGSPLGVHQAYVEVGWRPDGRGRRAPLIQDPERRDDNPDKNPELPENVVSALGIPVVTVPFGHYDDGTPFVLAFIGDMWSEAELLAWAYDLEQATRAGRAPVLEEPSKG
jgi:Asp-tRNA(Asn)/Glu-tRNA(Gln) amidotransferase A subunit family amidase